MSSGLNPSVPDYGFQAAFSDSLVRITPSAADSHATIQVNGKALASGSPSEYRKIQVGENANAFIIVITAENMAQKDYNVSVGRSPSSQSTLKSLAVSSGTLVRMNDLEYADTVSHGALAVTLTPVVSDPNASVTVNSTAVANGSASVAIPLVVGDNEIECLVTAQDGTTQILYSVHVTRLALLTRNRMLGSVISVLDSVEIPLGRPYQQSAPAVTGFHFVNWTTVDGGVTFGDDTASATSVTLSLGDARIQAKYDTNTYTLAVNTANGSVARSPNQAAYNHGKNVVLTVTPASGFQFSSWSDGNTANPRTLSMVSNTVLSATCTAIPIYTLTVTLAPDIPTGCVTTPSGSVNVGNGTATSITATNCRRSVASCGSGTVYLYYDFTGWSAVSGTPVFTNAGSASTKVTLSSGMPRSGRITLHPGTNANEETGHQCTRRPEAYASSNLDPYQPRDLICPISAL